MKSAIFIIGFALVGLSSSQSQLIDSGVSCEDVRLIVDRHNYYREQIANGLVEGQPGASDMQRMVWDDDLQEKAQEWADNMNFQHNPNRTDRLNRWRTGENLFMSWSSVNDPSSRWNSAIQAWYDEVLEYEYGPISRSNNARVGHYTQLVWANTRFVGCGSAYYRTNSNDGYVTLYVCNYGPPGNFIGTNPYTSGDNNCINLCCQDQCDRNYGQTCSASP